MQGQSNETLRKKYHDLFYERYSEALFIEYLTSLQIRIDGVESLPVNPDLSEGEKKRMLERIKNKL